MLMMITTHAAALGLPEVCRRGGHADLDPSRTLLESALQGPIVLRPEGVRSVLRPQQGLAGVTPGDVLRRPDANRRLMLLLCDLRAERAPETLFRVYLNLPKQADPATRARHLLAQFNFFAAVRPGDTATPIWQSFDITQTVSALAEQGVLETEATLTILAARMFDPDSRPSVGRIAIVRQ